jgi:hypothetical protein
LLLTCCILHCFCTNHFPLVLVDKMAARIASFRCFSSSYIIPLLHGHYSPVLSLCCCFVLFTCFSYSCEGGGCCFLCHTHVRSTPWGLSSHSYQFVIHVLDLDCCRHVQHLSVAEMRLLRWFCGHTKRDRVRNDDIRDRVGVAPIEEKLIQHRLRWFRHVQWRPPEAPVCSGVLKRADNVKSGRGRPK